MNVDKLIIEINEKIPNGKLIYLTLGGSHLFGLNTENSDLDVKGIYLPDTINVTAFIPEDLNLSTNKTNYKNSKEDVDVELWSIHKFFKLIQTGDTNAYDLLFSMFAPTVLIETAESRILKNNYTDLLSTNSKGFLGYVVAQTKRYGVKGERYDALKEAFKTLNIFLKNNSYSTQDHIGPFINYIEVNPLAYVNINYVHRLDNVGGGRYIEILNKQYRDSISFSYLLSRLEERLNQYGERSKAAAEGIDFKSLSHAYRIILEFEELLEHQFITFPLRKKDSVMRIKQGDLSEFGTYENLLNVLDVKVNFIENNLNNMTSFVRDNVLNKLLVKIFACVN